MNQVYGILRVIATSDGIKKEWSMEDNVPIRGTQEKMKSYVEEFLSILKRDKPSVKNVSWEVAPVEVN